MPFPSVVGASFGLLLIWVCPAFAQLASPMVIEATVFGSSDGKVSPSTLDTLVVLNNGTGALEGESDLSGQTVAGSYQAVVGDKQVMAAGTSLLLKFRHNGVLLPLLNSSGAAAVVTYQNAGFGFSRVRISLTVANASSPTPTPTPTPTPGGGSTGGTGGGSGTGTTAVVGDIDGNGKVDEADIAMLKEALSGRRPIDPVRMDVTGDKVVNTRDLIELIRMVRAGAQTSATLLTDPLRTGKTVTDALRRP